MIPIRQHFERKGTGFDRATWIALLRTAWEEAAAVHHRFTIPQHFTVAAASTYGYEARSKRYSIYKARKFGHRRPLELTGEMKRQIMRMRDVRASSKGARLVLHGPRYLYQYRKDLRDPDKAKELQAMVERDARTLAASIDRTIQRAMTASRRGVNITAGHRAG